MAQVYIIPKVSLLLALSGFLLPPSLVVPKCGLRAWSGHFSTFFQAFYFILPTPHHRKLLPLLCSVWPVGNLKGWVHQTALSSGSGFRTRNLLWATWDSKHQCRSLQPQIMSKLLRTSEMLVPSQLLVALEPQLVKIVFSWMSVLSCKISYLFNQYPN